MKTTKKIAFLILIFLTLQATPAKCIVMQERLYVPGNLVFRLELLSPISTKTNKKGDEFTMRVLEPENYYGATVSGRITKLKASGKANKKSEIAFAFNTIILGERVGNFDAQVTDVYEVVSTGNSGRADEEGTVKGKSIRKRSVKMAVVGAMIGAAIGILLGGGQGAAAGAAIGAGAGATTSISMKGPNLDFEGGTLFAVKTSGRNR